MIIITHSEEVVSKHEKLQTVTHTNQRNTNNNKRITPLEREIRRKDVCVEHLEMLVHYNLVFAFVIFFLDQLSRHVSFVYFFEQGCASSVDAQAVWC